MNKNGLNFPDDLLFMWDKANNVIVNNDDELKYLEYWQYLENALAKQIESVPGFENRRFKAKEAAVDYMINELFCGDRPENITAMGLLIRNFKKYLAQKNNPVQFELDKILRMALRTLEKNNQVKRESCAVGKNISGDTLFALSSVAVPESAIAEFSTYEARKHLIPQYTTKVRAKNWEKTQIIPPSIAQELVIKLLEVFETWTKERDLLSAIENHIPEQLNVVSESELISPDDEENSRITFLDDSADFFIYEYDLRDANFNAAGLSMKIWHRVCRVSDKSFCLYYLPVNLYQRQDITQSSAGDHRRVSEDCKKIEKIFKNELQELCDLAPNYDGRNTVIRQVISKIGQNLSGKCTEKGYSRNLYTSETTE